ncbi:MAG: NUDIX hydrolase [Rickettsiales bacterium]
MLDTNDWVNVLAITPEEQIVLVRQFRYGSRENSLEPPGGVVEKGESPLVAGLRELREETGYEGENPELIGVVRPNSAILSNRCHLVLVRNAQKTSQLEFDEHEELTTELYPLNQLKDLIRKGDISHSIGLNAILFLLLRASDSE